jgi:lipid II:glycine glycyltransferase (peptidoglycan interpeptide bridge formation enzyme)
VDLAAQRPLSERRRRALKKAVKVVTLSSDLSRLPALWAVLEDNLSRKHEAQPVHTLAEITLLFQRFPQWLQLRCALVHGQVEAGVVFFNASTVWHAQYIASSAMGYECNALDAVMHAAMGDAREQGARYFDFGTSNEDGGRVLNDGLYRFKSEFGGGGVVHEFYELALD